MERTQHLRFGTTPSIGAGRPMSSTNLTGAALLPIFTLPKNNKAHIMDAAGPQVDLSKLSDRDKQDLQQFAVNESQKARIQQSIHSLTDICFRKCITGKMSSGQLDRTEEPCMQNCVDRFMDANMTVLKHLENMRSA
ncbi:Mitochondrial import inner membrane translocase subunit tim8 [Zalaria obscura]|uniref:Mitochondrial import inner membrane translocase subunit tim8 n=1 Tax=Zalaria obscura TaxID=2024903 RepID=A0ACC3SH57_9PEZI